METRPWQRHYDYDVPTTLRYPRIGAHQLLGVAAGSFPDKAALSFFGSETTFWELRCQVLRAEEAARKKPTPIQPNDRSGGN